MRSPEIPESEDEGDRCKPSFLDWAESLANRLSELGVDTATGFSKQKTLDSIQIGKFFFSWAGLACEMPGLAMCVWGLAQSREQSSQIASGILWLKHALERGLRHIACSFAVTYARSLFACLCLCIKYCVVYKSTARVDR